MLIIIDVTSRQQYTYKKNKYGSCKQLSFGKIFKICQNNIIFVQSDILKASQDPPLKKQVF